MDPFTSLIGYSGIQQYSGVINSIKVDTFRGVSTSDLVMPVFPSGFNHQINESSEEFRIERAILIRLDRALLFVDSYFPAIDKNNRTQQPCYGSKPYQILISILNDRRLLKFVGTESFTSKFILEFGRILDREVSTFRRIANELVASRNSVREVCRKCGIGD